MKTSRILIMSAFAIVLVSAGLSSARAQELFNAVISTTCVSSNQDGSLVYQHSGNADLIMSCAGDLGVTNLSALSLVFNPTANALQVVAPTNDMSVGTNHMMVGTNQFLICTPLTFSNIVSFSGTNTNKVELLAAVLVETNSMASGTLAATERFQSNSSNQLTGFSLIGRIQYAVAASGTNSAEICRGVLVAGTSLPIHEEGEENENDNDHGHEGNNGNHGHGNNGNHGNGNNGNGNENHGHKRK